MLVEPISMPGKSDVQQKQVNLPIETNKANVAVTEEKHKTTPEPPQLKALTVELKDHLKTLHNVDLQFSIHSSSGKVMISITDEETGKLIREIPPRELLNLAAKIEEMMGLIFEQKA